MRGCCSRVLVGVQGRVRAREEAGKAWHEAFQNSGPQGRRNMRQHASVILPLYAGTNSPIGEPSLPFQRVLSLIYDNEAFASRIMHTGR